MEITPEQPLASKAKRSAGLRVLHKRVSLFSRSLLLVIAVIVAGIPAATCIPEYANNFMSPVTLRFLSCNGNTPGFCPDGPFVKT
jgi:hypothetical protein